MKLNLSEIKKWCDINKEFERIILFIVDNWNNDNIKNSLERMTFVENKFIKKDIIDLKEIEMYDEYLFEIASNIFFKKYIMKELDSSNSKFDVNRMQSLSEEEILSLHEEESASLGDFKKTIYYKSLKNYEFIDNKGEINVDMLSQYPKIKKVFIETSINIIKNYGVDWNEEVFNALVKMNIISQ